jgi:hypothetical protein
MSTFTPFPRSGLALGIPFILTTTLFAAASCMPAAPEGSDNGSTSTKGTGGSGPPMAPIVVTGTGGAYAPTSTDGSGGAGGSSAPTGGGAAFATCSSPAEMKGISAADFCAQYMSTCQFGAGAAKYTSVDDCKAKYGGYTGEQKWCIAYHLCKGAENNGVGAAVHCPHTAGGGGDPCKLAAAAAPDGGAPSGGGTPDAGSTPAAAASLKSDIYPLFMSKCQVCHGDLVKAPADLFKWLTDNAARAGCGPKMMPRKAVILSKTNPDPAVMPACGSKMPVGKMGDAEIWAKLKAWNTDGAKDN